MQNNVVSKKQAAIRTQQVSVGSKSNEKWSQTGNTIDFQAISVCLEKQNWFYL
jgi:hypothetical protein